MAHPNTKLLAPPAIWEFSAFTNWVEFALPAGTIQSCLPIDMGTPFKNKLAELSTPKSRLAVETQALGGRLKLLLTHQLSLSQKPQADKPGEGCIQSAMAWPPPGYMVKFGQE